MIKGINKNIIVVKNTGSKYFEEAHFIVKNNVSERSDRDIVKEAGRIVGAIIEGSGKVSKPKGGIAKKIIAFLLSFLSGAAIGILICLIS